jgi:hypothetical protein
MARMKSRPDMVRPASAVGTGSNQVMTRERGSPHDAGGDGGEGGGEEGVGDGVTAEGRPSGVTATLGGISGTECIVSCNAAYRMSPITQLTPDLNDPALGSSGIALGAD